MSLKSAPKKNTDSTCCSIESQTNASIHSNKNSEPKSKMSQSPNQQAHHHHAHDHDAHGHDGHDHSAPVERPILLFIPSFISFFILGIALSLDHFIPQNWFTGWVRILGYVLAYVPVGIPVLKEAWQSITKGQFFSEFFLMGVATLGAFAIGEYPEAVAVMLFYAIGEGFQTLAVSKATASIKSLLEEQPDEATVIVNQKAVVMPAEEVTIGAIIQLKPGEKLALDGVLLSTNATFNTSALTGESKPDVKSEGAQVLAGMINLNTVSLVKVTTAFEDSKLSKILELVQNATHQKAPTELFISKFAKVYTPIVVYLALGITFIPYFFVQNYEFADWLYRALVFLVISCPCALVISIPLGYFGGIGAGSKHGILFKGSNFLDQLAAVQHVVMDKTGTMTEGVFEVQDVHILPDFEERQFLDYVNLLESKSSHPIAQAIHTYAGALNPSLSYSSIEEFAGLGLAATIEDKAVLVGNFKLLDQFNIKYPTTLLENVYTIVAVAIDGVFAGYITIADELKVDAAKTIMQLHEMGIQTTMLSGDKNTVVQKVAQQLGIDAAYGDLLPEDKVNAIKNIMDGQQKVAFVGDGVNDAPVVALSDVGIAMGGLGSDATIETADVVIQDDQPSKIPMAIAISKKTKKIVWQNITLAFVVKGLVLLLGAGGIATMWEAVFADVGVALLAILNAVRIQKTKF